MNSLTFNPNWRPPLLETERLLIRPYEEADAKNLFPLVSNPNSTRFTLWEHHKSIEDTLFFVRDYALSRYAEGVPEPMAITLKQDSSSKPIGSLGCYWASHPNQTMEIGYWLAEPFWGRGIIVEACRVLVGYSFSQLGPKRIQARVIEGNTASVRVLEKLGFHYEGTLRSAIQRRGNFENVQIFSALVNEWLK
ncbi:MAG TPA: GNAT family protein [Urbifossiella sp.]|jgi:ribosomal-protein-alanine N-acetyltransferase